MMMIQMRYLALFLILMFPMYAFSQQPEGTEAETPPVPNWQVCNETSFVLRLAIAVEENGSPAAQGWTRLRPGGCEDMGIAITEPRYIYAESSSVHLGGVREWKGVLNLCASDRDFKANPDMTCALQDLRTRPFLTVPDGESVSTFTEPDGFGARAEIAGLQRLLRDNGYKITRIDGIEGRRTTNTLRRFLQNKELPTRMAFNEQIDALEKSAGEYVKSVGLTTCNKSSNRVWIALGKRHRETWKSQGWWPIEEGECIQPITKPLLGEDIHIYARQENPGAQNGADRLLRSVSTTPSQFCIADARFSALGRDHCIDNGYDAANFRALPSDKIGITFNLADNDFAEPSTVGLRQ